MVHPCVSSNVGVKQALAEAGYPLVHLSRPGHGFSASRLGVRIVSPLMRRAETPVLAERLVIDDSGSSGPLRQLRRRLAENRVVSITVGRSAPRVATAPFLDGGLRLPAGPITLAAGARAALLPVFTWGDPAHPVVRIGAPLPVRGTRDREVSIQGEIWHIPVRKAGAARIVVNHGAPLGKALEPATVGGHFPFDLEVGERKGREKDRWWAASQGPEGDAHAVARGRVLNQGVHRGHILAQLNSDRRERNHQFDCLRVTAPVLR